MRFRSILKKLWTLAVAVPLLFGSALASADTITQLGIAIDGSGSISSTEFAIQRDGLAAALAALPKDGTVEVTIVQFSSSAQVEVGPIVVDSQATLNSIIADVNSIGQIGGGTDPEDAVDLLTDEMTASSAFDSGNSNSIINLSTDGGFFLTPAVASAERAKDLGIDALTSEAIGSGADDDNLLAMVYGPSTNPGDGSAVLLSDTTAIPNVFEGGAPWVLEVADFEDFGAALEAKFEATGIPTTPVPEPGTLALLGLGLLAARFGVRRCRVN